MDLREGCCLELMKELPDNSIDLLFADLPYCQTKLAWDVEIDLELFWKEVNRVCKIDSPKIFTTTAKFGNLLINSNPKNFRHDLVWIKSCPVGFLNSTRVSPMRKHELIYVFYNKLSPVYSINIARHHKHKFREAEQKKNIVIKETTDVYGGTGVYAETDHASSKNYVGYGDNNNFTIYEPPLPNTVIEIKSEKGKHSTQKPVALMEWILKYYSTEGSIVLDPTMGSGSMGQACKNMERIFIGFEKDKDIFDVAFNRLIDV
tara:strand:- start:1896 stop:2678 length:783 start_codon:yes stop_codon:yes gene_type:complete